jgi:hypothetical protein
MPQKWVARESYHSHTNAHHHEQPVRITFELDVTDQVNGPAMLAAVANQQIHGSVSLDDELKVVTSNIAEEQCTFEVFNDEEGFAGVEYSYDDNDGVYTLTIDRYEEPELSDLIYQFTDEHPGSWEMESGVQRLEALVSGLSTSYGSLEAFFADNPGAIEAVVEWIAAQNLPEWRESLEESLDS